MKFLIVVLIQIVFVANIAFAQQAKFQTFKAKMTVVGEKDGEQQQWDNNDITVALDYENGNFISRLKNTDFYNKETYNTLQNEETEERELKLTGTFPIEKIIDQKSINATYNVEMELTTPSDTFILNINVEVTRPGEGQKGYRIFIMRGILYNDETNFDAFVSYENEISIILAFNAFWNN